MSYKELWKPIKGFEERYAISNLGRIKTIERYMDQSKKNARKSLIPERILKTRKNKLGYIHIQLFNGKKHIDLLIHRLVAAAFVDNPFDYPCVDHLDGNKSNNKYTNLEFVTIAENNQRAYDKGLKRRIHAGQFRKGSNWERIEK